ncbi:MAG: hypothetical protein GX446_01470 [Chthonomonadales bacterium]|nr:hypothetical protein [Chthonomonadales bacterium]
MNRTLAAAACAIGLAGIALIGLSQSPADSNLIRNPGFEQRGDPPEGWWADPANASKGSIELGPSPFGQGKLALVLRPTPANTDASKPLGVGQAIGATPYRGKRLYYGGTLRASGEATAVLGVFVMAKSGSMLGGGTLMRTEHSPGSERLEDTVLVPDTDEVAQIIMVCAVNGTSGSASFDNVALSAELPARLKASLADPGAPLHATVEVDAGKIVRTIPRTLYGINTEWVWNGNGIWDERKARLDPDLIRLTRELGVSLIRFPGGTFSDYYHWRDGLGDQDKRPWQSGLPGERKSRHVLGTEEMLAFARRAGGHLMITVNVGTGTAEEAADWVRYVNGRRDRADRVTWWEIGNEVYMNDGSPATAQIAMTPEQYAEKCAAFIRAMRRADASIKIGAISNESYWNTTHRDWDRKVLGKVGRDIDFVAVHNAYAPMVINDGGRGVREVYRATLAAPVHIRKSLAALRGRIGALPPADARRIKIAVTEWGTLYHALPTSRFVDHCKTLGSALYTASVLMAFLECPSVDAANYFKLVDQLFIGAIGVRGDRFAPTASYCALQMFTRRFGARLVKSATASPTFDAPALGYVPATSGAPYVEAVASLSADGRKLTIMAVNKHFDRSADLRIRTRAFRPARGGAVWTLTGSGLDANTGTAPKQVPGIAWAKQAEDEINPRFSRGGPNEVTVTRMPLRNVSSPMTYRLPAHSLVCIEMNAAPTSAGRRP